MGEDVTEWMELSDSDSEEDSILASDSEDWRELKNNSREDINQYY